MTCFYPLVSISDLCAWMDDRNHPNMVSTKYVYQAAGKQETAALSFEFPFHPDCVLVLRAYHVWCHTVRFLLCGEGCDSEYDADREFRIWSLFGGVLVYAVLATFQSAKGQGGSSKVIDLVHNHSPLRLSDNSPHGSVDSDQARICGPWTNL